MDQANIDLYSVLAGLNKSKKKRECIKKKLENTIINEGTPTDEEISD